MNYVASGADAKFASNLIKAVNAYQAQKGKPQFQIQLKKNDLYIVPRNG
jgi:hypothetical protein